MRFVSILAAAGLLVGAGLPAHASVIPEPVPAEVAVGGSDFNGPIYTTKSGMTLYVTGMDQAKPGTFGCTETVFKDAGRGPDGYPLPRKDHRNSCLDRWPVFVAGENAKPVGKWTIVTRPNGVKQWAYDNQPLYLSHRDKAAGEVNGTMGYPRMRGWRVVPLPMRFPPGVQLLHKVDGLLLGDDKNRIVFAMGARKKEAGPLEPLIAAELDQPFADWQIVTRPDGQRQWAYKKMPLFHSSDDEAIQQRVAAGDWRPIVFHKAKDRPKFLTMQMTVPEMGWVYADAAGHTLYSMICFDPTPDQLSCDEVGDPAAHWSALCGPAADCAKEWRPVLATPNDRPAGYWKIEEVPYPQFAEPTDAYGENVPKVRAWTFHGRPVYTFAADKKPGNFYGHTIESTASEFGALTVLGDEFPARP